MGLWIASFFIKKVIPITNNWERACHDQVKKVDQTVRIVSQGALAKKGLEIGAVYAVKSAGGFVGTCFPEAAIATGIALRAGQLVTGRLRSNKAGQEGFGSVLADLQGAAASSLTALIILQLSSSGYLDLSQLNSASLQFLLTMIGGMTGSWITLWMANKEPVGDLNNPVKDGYFSRSLRSSLTKEALYAGMAPIGISWPISVFVANTLSLGAFYAFPLSQAYQSGNRFSSFQPYDPNLLIKIMAHSQYENTAALAASLTEGQTTFPTVNRLMADLLSHGITHHYGVNFLVRTFNRYIALIQQDGYIRVALKEYSQALISNAPDLALKKEKLERYLYSNILQTEKFSARSISPRAVNEGVKLLVETIEKLEIELLGYRLSDPSYNQAMLEIQAQGFIHFALKTADASLKSAPPLTQKEIQEFCQNFRHILGVSYPSKITEVLNFIIPWILNRGQTVFNLILNGLSLQEMDENQFENEPYFDALDRAPGDNLVEIDEGDAYYDALDEVSEDDGEIYFDASSEGPPLFPADPANILKIAAHYQLGSTQALIDQISGKIPLVPLFHTLVKKMVSYGIDSDLFLNSFVRVMNKYSILLTQNEEVNLGIKNFILTGEKKPLNKLIRQQIDPSLTKSFAIVVTHTLSLSGHFSKAAKQIVTQLVASEDFFYKFSDEEKINCQELLEIHLHNLTILAMIRAQESRLREIPLTIPELDQFYLNFNRLIWTPLSDPAFDPIKNGLNVLIPSLVESSPQIASYFPHPSTPVTAPEKRRSSIFSSLRHSIRFAWVKTKSIFHYFRKLFNQK